MDRSKSDALLNVIAMIQSLYLLIQVVARDISGAAAHRIGIGINRLRSMYSYHIYFLVSVSFYCGSDQKSRSLTVV